MVSIEQLRKHRISEIALFDLIGSFILIISILLFFRHKYRNTMPIKNFVIVGFLITIPIGIFFHLIFGINTALNRKLGLSKTIMA